MMKLRFIKRAIKSFNPERLFYTCLAFVYSLAFILICNYFHIEDVRIILSGGAISISLSLWQFYTSRAEKQKTEILNLQTNLLRIESDLKELEARVSDYVENLRKIEALVAIAQQLSNDSRGRENDIFLQTSQLMSESIRLVRDSQSKSELLEEIATKLKEKVDRNSRRIDGIEKGSES